MVAPITSEYRSNADELAGGWRVDLHTIADVDPYVRDARRIRICKEHHVPWLRIAHRDGRIELINRDPRQIDSNCRVHVLDETTAVHTRPRTAAKQIGNS